MPTLQERYFEVLMDKVRADKYPSHQMLTWLENSIATPDQMAQYVDLLLDNVESTHYPSGQMVQRIQHMMMLGARGA